MARLDGKKFREIWTPGAPPSLGWWPTVTSTIEATQYRWWDGRVWSLPLTKNTLKEFINTYASTPSARTHKVLWKPRPDNWPKESYT